MRPSPPEAPANDDVEAAHHDLLTVEAPTAEQAIEQVHERLGPDAEIVAADRVLRGGLWGFFPKQVVQLTARPVVDAPEPEQPEPVAPLTPAGGGDISSVLARLSAEQDNAEEGLGEALRRHLGVTIDGDAVPPSFADTPQPSFEEARPRVDTAVSATSGWSPPAVATDAPRVSPAPRSAPDITPASVPDRVPDDTAPISMDNVEWDGPDGAAWSGRGLLMLGLPRGFVDAVLAQSPTDDAAWTYAVARVLAPLCRPMPAGEAVLIGPRAQTLGRALGVPSVKLSAAPTGTATFAVACVDSARARTWLAEHRRHRWTHLVISGLDWRGLLFEDPLAVSWVGDDTLGEAIRVAHDLGMVLGHGLRSETSEDLVPPVPIELAMLLRDMLGGRR